MAHGTNEGAVCPLSNNQTHGDVISNDIGIVSSTATSLLGSKGNSLLYEFAGGGIVPCWRSGVVVDSPSNRLLKER